MPEEYDSDDIVFKEKKKEDSKNGDNRKQEQSVIEMEAKRATATSFGSKLMKQTGVGFGNAHVGEKAGDLDFSKGMDVSRGSMPNVLEKSLDQQDESSKLLAVGITKTNK